LEDAITCTQEFPSNSPWLELLCINNASTDSSQSSLDQAWHSFPCKSFATFENILESTKGVSYARNRGLRHSTGDYIVFIDSDDRINPGYFSALLEGVKLGVDVINLSFSATINENTLQSSCLMPISDFVSQFLTGWWCWSFVAPRRLYSGLCFYGQCYEDVGLYPFLLSRSQYVFVIPSSYYEYSKTSDSLTTSPPSWRYIQWDKQVSHLRRHISLLLPVISIRIARELLEQRMILRSAAGFVPVLGPLDTVAYIRTISDEANLITAICILILKNFIALVRFLRRTFSLILP
jgi:glycosyltransferase involved in cell wall biosynthesis